MSKPVISVAGPEHGNAIRELICADHWHGLEAIDWSDLAGQWCIVTLDKTIGACVQLLPGRPLGRIEHMGLAGWLSKRERAQVVGMIITYGCALLKIAGCQAVLTSVPHDLKGYRRVLERRGAVEICDTRMMIKRLV